MGIKENLVGLRAQYVERIGRIEEDLRDESDFCGNVGARVTELAQLNASVAAIDKLNATTHAAATTQTRTEQMLTTVTENAKARVKAALARIIKWRATSREDAIAKLEAIEGLCGTFAGIDTLELTNICLNLREKIANPTAFDEPRTERR